MELAETAVVSTHARGERVNSSPDDVGLNPPATL
jgi:hypothetical protein